MASLDRLVRPREKVVYLFVANLTVERRPAANYLSEVPNHCFGLAMEECHRGE